MSVVLLKHIRSAKRSSTGLFIAANYALEDSEVSARLRQDSHLTLVIFVLIDF